jgi:hypothetical protein
MPVVKKRKTKVFTFQAEPDVEAALRMIRGPRGTKTKRINEALRRHLGGAARAVLMQEIEERKARLERLGELLH